MISLKIKKHKLSNGLNVFFCHTPHDVAFEISMHIFSGLADENEFNNGVSHFLEHMMFRGSKSFPDSISLAKAMERYGGEINTVTGNETTNYWMKGDAECTLEAIRTFSDFFLSPIFSDIEIERKVILQELASDYNDAGACIDIEYLGMHTLFKKHALGLPIIGTQKTIEKMSLAELIEKRNQYYFPANCILTINSNVPEAKVIKEIEAQFLKQWPAEKNQKIPEKFPFADLLYPNKKKPKDELFLQNNLDNQYSLKLVLPTVGSFSPEVVYITFLQRLLDDGICTRLPANIREKHGLVYDISCETQFYKDIGIFSVDAIVSEHLLEELIEKLSFELKNLINEIPTQDEIEHIKYRYLFDLKQISQSASRMLNREVSLFFYDKECSLAQEIETVKNMTAYDFHEVVKQVFSCQKMGFALVGPKAKKRRKLIENFLSQLRSKL